MYALGNVVEENRVDPGFSIPPPEVREQLQPGDLAQLMMISDRDAEEAWVQVTDVVAPGYYAGIFENGAPVEFSADNVADVREWESFAPSMGASKPDPFEVLRRARAERRPDPFEVLNRPAPPRRPDPFEVLRREVRPAPPAPKPEPASPRTPAPEGSGLKKRFFQFLNSFRRKPHVEVSPIPEAEQRRRVPPQGPVAALPVPAQEVQAPAEGTFEAQPPERQDIVIVPPSPQAWTPPQQPPGTALVPGETAPQDDPFGILTIGPAGEEPAPPPSRALVLPESRLPSLPASESDIFDLLTPPPGASQRPAGGLVVSPESYPPSPAEPDAFTMLQPEAPRGAPLAPAAADEPFEILAPEPPSPFEMLVPEPGAITPYQEQSGGLSPFDIIPPAGGGAVAPYDPNALDPFSMIEPPPAQPRQEEAAPQYEQERREEAPKPPPKKRTKKPPAPQQTIVTPWTRRKGEWIPPSPEKLIPWIRDEFVVEKIWDLARDAQEDPDVIAAVMNEDEGAFVPFQTLAGSWGGSRNIIADAAEAMGIPDEVFMPYIVQIEKEESEESDPSEVYDELHELIFNYGSNLSEAFELLKPKDIPGYIALDYWEDQIVLGYMAALTRAEIDRMQQEADEEARIQKAGQDARKKALRKIWGRMPTAEELLPFIEDKFDVAAMWKAIRKERKTRGFKETLEDQGKASVILERIAADGPDFYNEIAYFFGLPPEVISLYLDAKPPLQNELWAEVLHDFFDEISEAFNLLKPKDLPGAVGVAGTDDDQDLYLQYMEAD